jgi:hypothetical protein
MTRAIIVKREGAYVITAAGAELAASLAAQSRIARDRAEVAASASEVSAAYAESMTGPTYANTSAGLAATTDGEGFAVDNGDGTVTVYLNNSGVADEQRTLATTAALADATGASMVGVQNPRSGTVSRNVYEVLADFLTVEWWGAVGDGTTDDTLAIQAMIDAVGYFKLSQKTYKITDSLTIPAGGPYNRLWSGRGMQASALLCDGMTGLPALKLESPTGLYRVTMRDFRIYGDCDTALDLSGLAGGDQIYASSFSDLWLESAAGSCIKADNNFSCDFTNVHVSSTGGHGFELKGDIVRTLTNCYAHVVGTGMAGYRIWGQANLIGCNGLDGGQIWGDFGARSTVDTVDSQYVINMVGCNIEDFTLIGIRLRYIGSLVTLGCNWVGKASTAVTALVSGADYQEAGWTWVDRGGRWLPKSGSSVTNNYRLQSKTDARLLDVGNSLIGAAHWRNTAAGVSYNPPNITTNLPASNTPATRFDMLDYARSYGFNLQVPTLWTVNATTFAVTRISAVRTANSSATSFATATGGELGQRLVIIVQDANTTITHGTGANQFTTTSGSNITAANGGVYEFVFNGTLWRQV